MKTKAIPLLVEILTGGITIVFFYAVYLMISGWDQHLQNMNEQAFNDWWATVMTWVIPIAYSLIGGTIAYRARRRVGLWIALGYISILSGYLTLGKFHVIEICSCIGFISSGAYWQNIYFNAKFAATILLTVALDQHWLAQLWVSTRCHLKKWKGRVVSCDG